MTFVSADGHAHAINAYGDGRQAKRDHEERHNLKIIQRFENRQIARRISQVLNMKNCQSFG